MTDDEHMAKVEETGVIKHPPGALTLPCSLTALNEWLKDAHCTSSGAGPSVVVTGSATSLSVA